MDKSIDEVQKAVFFDGKVRSWVNENTQVFLPAADEDVFLVFTHFVKHFYKEGGVTLRQMCDWCRLLWTYRESLNYGLLESRIRQAGLMSEWKAFYNLGMPDLDSRLMFHDSRFDKKADKIVDFILKGGEWRKWRDTMTVAQIFPWNTLKFSPGILFNVNWMKIKERAYGGQSGLIR